MAAPLLDLVTQQRDSALAAETAARQSLSDARAALAQARLDRDAVVAQLAALEKELTAIRAALAEVETPADGEPLLAQLGEKTIAHRAKQAELLDKDEALAAAASAEARAAAGLRGASDRLKKTEANRQAVEDEDRQRTAWRNALGEEPLSTLRSNASDALNSAPENEPFTAAKARIESDIPAALIVRARERRSAAVGQFGLADAALAAAQEISAAKLSYRFRRSEAKLRDYVTQGRAQFDRAVSLLAKVANPATSPLTSEQQAHINDTTLVTDGTTAAAAEKTRDEARAELEAKQAALDQAILAAKTADIDADPGADTDVQTATGERDTAQGALDAAETAYTAEMKADLDAWEAAVPDETWRLLDEFEESAAILNELASTDPASLTAGLEAAETAYADALEAEDKKIRTQRFLDEEIAARDAAAAFEWDAAGRRRFQTARGDS